QEAGNLAVDYINTHATSTPAGDIAELQAMREVFREVPPFSSTKGLTGHAVGASGAQEAIHCLLMMQHGFIAGCANLDDPDPALRRREFLAGRWLVEASRSAWKRTGGGTSISHSGGWVACALLERGSPGVDIEPMVERDFARLGAWAFPPAAREPWAHARDL